jgi:hypothetical protein
MSVTPHDRRGFLRGLASLPLIGGSVALIGEPSRASTPITPRLLDTYEEWLGGEWVALIVERTLAGLSLTAQKPSGTAAMRFHNPLGLARPSGSASERAAVVLSAVGCDWESGASPTSSANWSRR